MKRLLMASVAVLGMVSSSVHADCPMDGYSDSFKVTVNGEPLVCQGTQRAYLGAAEMRYFKTAVCSTEKTDHPAVRTATWVADSIEENRLTGTAYISAYGKNCTFSEVGQEVNGWKCQEWEKAPEVRIDMGTCHDFSGAFDYSVTEKRLSGGN